MKRRYWITAVVVAGLGVLALVMPGRFRTWREEHSIATTHITYSHFACSALPCPAFQFDVYGDGTVIYHGYQHVAVAGAYIYHVPRQDLQAYIKDFRVSSFWQKVRAAAATPQGGGCRVDIITDHRVRHAGCFDVTGDDNMTLEAPRLNADIVQLEALIQLDALVKGQAVTGTTASPTPVTGMRPYVHHSFGLLQKPIS